MARPRKLAPQAPDPRAVGAVREIVRRQGLRGFVRLFWRQADPASTYVEGWAVGAICEALEAVSARQIRRLVINIPPGMSKSSVVSVHWPAWQWAHDPAHKWIIASHDYTLVLRDAAKMLEVIQSGLYQAAFPRLCIADVPAVGLFTNKQGGLRFSTSIGGRAVGWHSDTQIVDDPHKPIEARNPDALKKAVDWWQGTMSTRRTDAANFARVVVMQRIAEDDLSGACLAEGYEHLCLPMQYTRRHWSDLSARLDQRTETDEPLFPERFPPEAIEDLKRALKTPLNVSAQLAQDPIPDKGGIIEKDWIRRWAPGDIPARGVVFVQSWDFNFKGTDDSHSRVVGELWAAFADRYCLIDEVRGLWNYPEAKRRFVAAQSRPGWDAALIKLIEEKANGIAIIDEAEEGIIVDGKRIKVTGIVRVNPKEDKRTRLIARSDLFEAGLVYVPRDASWTDEWIAEVCAFPRGKSDDRVDVTTQALDRLHTKGAKYAEQLRGMSR